MSQRQNISSGTRYEAEVGYSRAVRIGRNVWVAGTTAIDENMTIIGKNDAYLQAKFILEKIGRALTDAGATFHDVVRTRMFVTDINLQARVGAAHAEVFSAIRPVATMVEITRLVDPKLLVEIEVDAYIASGSD